MDTEGSFCKLQRLLRDPGCSYSSYVSSFKVAMGFSILLADAGGGGAVGAGRCFPGSSTGKESSYNTGNPGSVPELGRFPGEGKGYPLPGLENAGSQRVGHNFHYVTLFVLGFPGGSDGKASACNVGDQSSIPGLGRAPGEGNGNPLRYSCLENPRD